MSRFLRYQFLNWFLLLGFLAPPPGALAQAPFKHLQGCFDPENEAAVVGRILGAGVPDIGSRHYALLEGADYCMAVPDSLGRFEFTNVRAGDYRLLVTGASPGLAPIQFSLRAADSITLSAEIEPYDVVGDCSMYRPCREIIEPRPHSALIPDVDPLVEAGFRTAVAVAWTKAGTAWEWVPCFRRTTPPLMAQLRMQLPTAVPAEDCESDWRHSATRDARVIHRASGRPAIILEFRLLDRTENFGEGIVTLSVAPLWGAEWQCYYQRLKAGWQLTSCALRGLS